MLELWFDFSCPYAYLASRRAHALGVPIDWRPMLLGGVFRGIGAGDGPMATLSAQKAKHNAEDMQRWAKAFDVPFRMPAAHPMRTVRALRVLLALPHSRWPEAIAAIYAAYWERNEDVTSDAVIAAALVSAGVDAGDAFARADDPAIKDELRRRTDEAIGLGIFGAPAWVLRDRGLLLWGQDRMAWLTEVLAGWNPDAGSPPGGPRTITAARAPGHTLDVFFDVSSPFAYLGLTQLGALAAQSGVTPRLVPILLGALFRDIGTGNVPLFEFPPAKLRYISGEMSRWANWWGVPFAMPKKFPQRTIAAQRLCVIATERDFATQLALALALGRAMWAEDRDLEDEATLRQILDGLGLPVDWVARTQDPAVKQGLIATTAEAKARGVFGVPTWIVDGELYWGQDRLDMVAAHLC